MGITSARAAFYAGPAPQTALRPPLQLAAGHSQGTEVQVRGLLEDSQVRSMQVLHGRQQFWLFVTW